MLLITLQMYIEKKKHKFPYYILFNYEDRFTEW
jgi:hypothetical protein